LNMFKIFKGATVVLLILQFLSNFVLLFPQIEAVQIVNFAPSSIVHSYFMHAVKSGFVFPKFTLLPTLAYIVALTCLQLAAAMSVTVRKRGFPIALLLLYLFEFAYCVLFAAFVDSSSAGLWISAYKIAISAITVVFLFVYLLKGVNKHKVCIEYSNRLVKILLLAFLSIQTFLDCICAVGTTSTLGIAAFSPSSAAVSLANVLSVIFSYEPPKYLLSILFYVSLGVVIVGLASIVSVFLNLKFSPKFSIFLHITYIVFAITIAFLMPTGSVIGISVLKIIYSAVAIVLLYSYLKSTLKLTL